MYACHYINILVCSIFISRMIWFKKIVLPFPIDAALTLLIWQYTISVTYTVLHKMKCKKVFVTSLWCHNGRDGVSNQQPHDCLVNRSFRRRSKQTSKLRVTGLCLGNSPVIGEFPAQKNSNAEIVFIWWRHHETSSRNLFIRFAPCFAVICFRSLPYRSGLLQWHRENGEPPPPPPPPPPHPEEYGQTSHINLIRIFVKT